MLPKITLAIIENVRDQTYREQVDYISNKLGEMIREDQMVLATAIVDTAGAITENIKESGESVSEDVLIMIRSNLVLMGLSVYSSIKEQVLCNELEEQWK